LFIASLLVTADASGDSVFGLAQQIRASLSIEGSIRLDRIMLEVFGDDYTKADEFRYDRSFALESLRFFAIEAVPRLAEELPDGVLDLEYSIDFSFLDESDKRTIMDLRFCDPS